MPTGPRSKRRGIRPAVVGLALAPPVFVGTFLLVTKEDGAEQSARTGATEPGLAHVHGLGINPADGLLSVANHDGTYVIPDDGSAERVGTSSQDTMGLPSPDPTGSTGAATPMSPASAEANPGSSD